MLKNMLLPYIIAVEATAFVRHLYISLVRPVLEYAGPVWDSCTLEDCLRVERLQLSVARAILRASRRTKSDVSVLAEIGWPTLGRFCKAKFVCKF